MNVIPFPATGDPWLNVKQVSNYLGLCPRTIQNYAQHYGLPHARTPGNHLRFRRSEVDAWMGRNDR